MKVDTQSTRPQAKWDDQRAGFILAIPTTAIITPLECIPTLKEDLRTAFDLNSQTAQTPVTGAASAPVTALPVTLPDHSIQTTRQPIQYLPDVASLPRPDELLQRVPYYMIVRTMGERIDIECTHSPSLNVLAAYLQRWCRTNHNLSTKVCLLPSVPRRRMRSRSIDKNLTRVV